MIEKVKPYNKNKETLIIIILSTLILSFGFLLISLIYANQNENINNEYIYTKNFNQDEIIIYNFIEEYILKKELNLINEDNMENDYFEIISFEENTIFLSKNENVGTFYLKDNKIFYYNKKLKNLEEFKKNIKEFKEIKNLTVNDLK